jgi:hypothetical protein
MSEALLTMRLPLEPRDVEAAREAFACHATQYTAPEMAAINRYLVHAWDGRIWLRPWMGALRDTTLFGR